MNNPQKVFTASLLDIDLPSAQAITRETHSLTTAGALHQVADTSLVWLSALSDSMLTLHNAIAALSVMLGHVPKEHFGMQLPKVKVEV